MFNRSQLKWVLAAGLVLSLQVLPHRYFWVRTSFVGTIYQRLLSFAPFLIILAILAVVATRDVRTQAKRKGWLLTHCTILILALAFPMLVSQTPRGLPAGSFADKFDATVWGQDTSVHGPEVTARQRMLGDVIANVVMNKYKSEIISQLGQPNRVNAFRAANWDLIYATGPQRDAYIPVDYEWLLIWFGPNGRVSRYEIWSD